MPERQLRSPPPYTSGRIISGGTTLVVYDWMASYVGITILGPSRHSQKDFTNNDFSGVTLTRMSLSSCSMRACNIAGSTFKNCGFDRVDFHDVDMSSARFIDCTFSRCCTSGGADLTQFNEEQRSQLTRTTGYLWTFECPGGCGAVPIACECERCEVCERRVPHQCSCDRCGGCRRLVEDCECERCDDCDSRLDDCCCNTHGDVPRDSLHSYSANVIHALGWPRGTPKDALLFGVELECEPKGTDSSGRRNTSSTILSKLGGSTGKGFICKSDGSLSDGVEIVTLPYTLGGHRKQFGWKELLSPALHAVAKSGVGTTNCGIHIHINKRALSPLTIGKMLVFCNSDTMKSLITAIAQRGSGSYCGRSKKKLADGKRRGGTRYDILNVSNGATVEVRMFRGNLRAERVLKNIEFCHSLVSYCRDTSIMDFESWKNYTRWLIERRGEYPELVKFLIEKRVPGFAQPKRPAKAPTVEPVLDV